MALKYLLRALKTLLFTFLFAVFCYQVPTMFALLRFGIKAGIATSAVYLTIDNGVWSDSETTTELYNQVTTEASKYLSPYVEKVPLPELPRTGSVIGTAQNMWNQGVKATFRFLVVSPICAAGTIKRGYKYLEEQVLAATNAPPAS